MQTTKDFFEDLADRWDNVNRYDRAPDCYVKMLEALRLQPGDSVVDLGCGTGTLIPFLLEAVGKEGFIYAVDVSEKMIGKLVEKYPTKNIKVLAIDVEKLSSIKNKVDAVVCFSAFPHFENKDIAVSQISSILKSGGRLTVAHFSSRNEINSFHSKMPEPICRHVLPDEKTMRELCEKHLLRMVNYIDKPGQYELTAEKT